MGWANLRANDLRRLPHFLPDPNRRGVHIEQSHLLAAFSAETIDADFVRRLLCPDSNKYGSMLTAGAFSMFCMSSALCATI